MVEGRNGENLDPVTEQELRSLPRERRPPQDLETEVTAGLRREGLLGSRRLASMPWMRAAAAAAFLAIGFASGAWWMRPPIPRPEAPQEAGHERRFLLLLHESTLTEARAPERQAALIQEYKAWAAHGVKSGFLLEGEKLREERVVLAEPDSPGEAWAAGGESIIGGYFVIRAADPQEALRLARTCPHLRHGGQIEVREIDPV